MRHALALANQPSTRSDGPPGCFPSIKLSFITHTNAPLPPRTYSVRREGYFGVSNVYMLSCEQDGHAQLTLVGVEVDVAAILDGQANLVDVFGCKLACACSLK